MAPLSEDLRLRIINTWKRGKLTGRQLAERFAVGAATVTRLKRRYRDTKSVKPKPHGGGQKRRIGPEQEPLVEALVRQHPDWTEDQYAEELLKQQGIEASAITVGRAIRRLGYSVKKSPSSRKSATAPTSSSGDDSTSSKSQPSPLRIWFLWTKPAPTRR